jgi:hypothetical protein
MVLTLKAGQDHGTMPLTRLIYVSRRLDHDPATLDAILRASSARNEEDGITGALIASDGHYLQVLEGRRAAVGRCLARIGRNACHCDLQVVSAGESRHRLFPTWAMRAIGTSMALRLLVGRYAAPGVFRPEQMSQLMIEDLFRRLAVDLCEAPAGPDRVLRATAPAPQP